MRVYTPDFRSSDVTLDSIPFRKGVFRIPQHIYDLKEVTKVRNSNYKPKVNGDWDLFSDKVHYVCLIEKTEDLDNVSHNIYSQFSDKRDEISIDREVDEEYSFKYNTIIRTTDQKNYSIYQVKGLSDTTFYGDRIPENQIHVSMMFVRDNILYGVITKFYSGWPSGTTYGIYKLHFIDETLAESLAAELKMKQTEEDYRAAVRLLNYPEHNPNNDGRLSEIKSKYEALVKNAGNKN